VQERDPAPYKKHVIGDAVQVRAGNAPRNTAPQKKDQATHEFDIMKKRHDTSNSVSIGDKFNCAYCGKEAVKMNIGHKNCSPKCRNAYNKLAARHKKTTQADDQKVNAPDEGK
jgi:predicted nucleic acid-binding Zn ribbon protein